MYFVVGYALFALCYGVLGWNWLLSKVIADVTGLAIDFIIQKTLTFRQQSKGSSRGSTASKFGVLSIVNIVLDYLIVGGLNKLGVTPYIGVVVSAVFFTVWKWFWYKYWVFKGKDKARIKRVQ